MSADTAKTTVLIIGGGPAGLTAAALLAARNVPTILVERHPASSGHPRAIGFTPRSLEIYRTIGLADAIPQIPPGMSRPRRIRVDSLAGKWHDEKFWSTDHETSAVDPEVAAQRALRASPCTGAGIAQDKLEPIVRQRAAELGADLRLNTQMLSFEQDEDGVTAKCQPRDGSPEYSIRARYMIAADGAASSVREALGITRHGQGKLSVVRSVLFRADIDEYLEAGISQFDITQPDFQARLVTYRDGRWALMFEDDEERDDATLRKLVVRAIGREDRPVELITTGRWELAALIADSYSKGRVFLAGDAAHAFPPARGGYGANTGIDDVHNLVWKLESVLSGLSDPSLLDTYDIERRAIADLRHGQIFNSEDYADFAKPEDKLVPRYDDIAMEFGQLYRSAAVIGAGEDLPPARTPDEWCGQPGTRVPHIWVYSKGKRISTLDVVGPDWVLLTADDRWKGIASDVARSIIEPEKKGLMKKLFSSSDGLRFKLSTYVAGREQDMPAPGGANALDLESTIETIVATPEGKALLESNIPEIAGHPDYARFKAMSLTQLRPMAPKQITDERLTKIEVGLAAIPAADAAMMSLDTPIEQIMANDEAKAVLVGVVPSVSGHKEYQRFKSMTLRQLQPLAAKELTDEVLAKIEAEISGIENCGGNTEPVDPEAVKAEFRAALGIGSAGASLVRPDGYIAWRTVDMPTDAAVALSEAIRKVAAIKA